MTSPSHTGGGEGRSDANAAAPGIAVLPTKTPTETGTTRTLGEPKWRCFHCEFATSDEQEARQHFGPTCIHDAVCQLTEAQTRREYLQLDADYTRACNEINRLRTAPAWQPIEGAPKDTVVLVWAKFASFNGRDHKAVEAIKEVWPSGAVHWYRVAEGRHEIACDIVTHWQPVRPPIGPPCVSSSEQDRSTTGSIPEASAKSGLSPMTIPIPTGEEEMGATVGEAKGEAVQAAGPNSANINKLIERLRAVPESDFDMDDWWCGTCGCIGGHTNAMMGQTEWGFTAARQALGLGGDQASALFYEYPASAPRITRAQAIRVLEHLRDKGEVDWSKRGRR